MLLFFYFLHTSAIPALAAGHHTKKMLDSACQVIRAQWPGSTFKTSFFRVFFGIDIFPTHIITITYFLNKNKGEMSRFLWGVPHISYG
jgi:hypothetical protein